MSQYRVCHDQHFASTDTWDVHSSTIGGFPMDAYTGTQESVNTFFARLELQTGLCEPYHLAQKMGIPLHDPATEMVPSFTLGVASVSPLELADAYATFAARGLHCDPRPVTSIDDSDGNQLKSYPQQCQQAFTVGQHPVHRRFQTVAHHRGDHHAEAQHERQERQVDRHDDPADGGAPGHESTHPEGHRSGQGRPCR